MRRWYRLLMSAKEHPETGVLLYPGDLFEVEDALIERPQTEGGWQQEVEPRGHMGDVPRPRFDRTVIAARAVGPWELRVAVRVDPPEGDGVA